MRGQHHRVQRVSQVVTEYGDEHLVQAQRFGALVQLVRELQLLAVKLEERVRLSAQHVRIDGLVQEVDRAGLVTAERAHLIAHPGGDEDDRHRAGSLTAPHELGELEAVHLGHLHVQQRPAPCRAGAAGRALPARTSRCGSPRSARATGR